MRSNTPHNKQVNTEKPVSTEPLWNQFYFSEYTGVHFMQVKLTKISYIGTLFKVMFIQDIVQVLGIRYRSLKKCIFRYQDLVEIYSVSAETMVNDGFS